MAGKGGWEGEEENRVEKGGKHAGRKRKGREGRGVEGEKMKEADEK